MRCSNKVLLAALTLVTLSLTACGKEKLPLEYGKYNLPDNYNIESMDVQSEVPLFASDICAVKDNITDTSSIDPSSLYGAGVFDVNTKKTLYAYNVNERVNPASLTKIMTALVVIENCNLDDVVTVPDVSIGEEGVQTFGLKEGDKITVKNLLYISLVYSGNDASLCLAKYVAGSEAAFAEMMNAKAASLGASNSHFINPHGLTSSEHYTTAYDLYLIFNAACKHQEFLDIISTDKYTVSYTTAEGEAKDKEISTTNKFLTGGYTMPGSVQVQGGKTGSTAAAGKCIILYDVDGNGNPYISVVMGASSEENLYNTMIKLCNDTIR